MLSQNRATPDSRSISRTGIAASLVAGATDVLYVAIILGEGNHPLTESRIAFIALFIAVSGCAAFVAAMTRSMNLRLVLIAFATGSLAAAGIAGIFSIGIFLLTAGILAAIGWARARQTGSTPWRALAWGAAALGVFWLLAGLSLT